MTEELDLSMEKRWEDRFLGIPTVVTLVVLLAVLGVVVGDATLIPFSLALLPVVFGARRALRRRRERRLFARAPVEDELQPSDDREFGADFIHDFYAALPAGLLVIVFGWLVASPHWGSGWNGIFSWLGFVAASTTFVAHVAEGGSRLAHLVKGHLAVGQREEQEALEARDAEMALPSNHGHVQYDEG